MNLPCKQSAVRLQGLSKDRLKATDSAYIG